MSQCETYLNNTHLVRDYDFYDKLKIANTNHACQYTCNSMPFDICQMKDVDVTYYSVLSV